MKRLLLICLLILPFMLFADSGGPDLFGYSWVDSRDGVPFEWHEIKDTGERLSISTSDDGTYTVTLDEPFVFYGVEQTELTISTNGCAAFGRVSYMSLSTSGIPSGSTVPFSLGLAWCDLAPHRGTGQGIYFQEFDDKIVVEWDQIPMYSATSQIFTFQAVFYKGSKTLMFNYLSMMPVTSTYTTAYVGITNADNTDGLQCGMYSATSLFLEDSLSIRIRATPTATPPYFNDCSSFDDFQLPEDEESGWELGSPEVGPSMAHSGSHCIGTDLDDNYGDAVNWVLMTPDLDLGSATSPVLDFWTWYDMQDGIDGGICEISTDDGETWHIVESEQGYPTLMTGTSPISGLDAYSGSSDGWEYVSFNLRAYAGEMCKFRLRMISDGSISAPGWYIDDLGLQEQYGVITGIVDLAYETLGDSVTIQLIQDGRTIMSEYDGFFWFDSVKVDSAYTIKFTKPGYLGDSLLNVSVARLETTDVFIILAPELYYNDFALDAEGYVTTPDDGWQWGIPNPDLTPTSAHSDSMCWGTNLEGNYRDGVDWTLDFTIDLGPLERPALRYWQWYDLAGEYAGQFFDGCNVKISIDGGESFEVIELDPRYEMSYDGIAASHNDFISGEYCWGGSGYGDYWHYVTFDLIPYAHNEVIIRFELASDGVGRSRGWYIDDLQISDNWQAIEEPVRKIEKPEDMAVWSYPNPFNSTCDIIYEVPSGETTGKIDIYSIDGKIVTHAPLTAVPGTHTFLWNASGIPTGVYHAKVTIGNNVSTTKMLLVK